MIEDSTKFGHIINWELHHNIPLILVSGRAYIWYNDKYFFGNGSLKGVVLDQALIAAIILENVKHITLIDP